MRPNFLPRQGYRGVIRAFSSSAGGSGAFTVTAVSAGANGAVGVDGGMQNWGHGKLPVGIIHNS